MFRYLCIVLWKKDGVCVEVKFYTYDHTAAEQFMKNAQYMRMADQKPRQATMTYNIDNYTIEEGWDWTYGDYTSPIHWKRVR